MSEQTQKISLATATLVCMMTMMGAGIYLMPGVLGASIGPAGILTVVLVALCVLAMAITIGRVANAYPQAGSFYIYASQWGGHRAGMIAAGAYIVGFLISASVLARFIGVNLNYSFPSVPAWLFSILAVVVVTALHLMGARVASIGQRILICCAVAPLLIIGAICWTKASFVNLVPFAPYGYTAILFGMGQVVFSFMGFEAATSLFSQMEKPEINVPRALIFAVVFVALLYLFFLAGIIMAIPLNLLADPNVSLAAALHGVVPATILNMVHAAITLAVFGSLFSLVWGVSALFASLTQLMRGKTISSMVSAGRITAKTCVLFVGICVLIGIFVAKGKQILCFPSLFVVWAYLSAILAMVVNKKEWQSKTIILTLFSFIAALGIFGFAFQGVIKAFIG